MANSNAIRVHLQPPCGPVDVLDLWNRMEAWLGANAPALLENLAPGATKDQINEFERRIGRELPDDVRAFLRVHNGQVDPSFQNSIFCGLHFISLDESLRAWELWKHIEVDDDLNEQVREIGSVLPKGAINNGYANVNWIAVAKTFETDYFGVDLDPGPKGLRGQVINFGRDEEDKVVIAWSWGWFFRDLVEELEYGNFRSQRGEGGEEDNEASLVLQAPAPAHGNFYNATREWAQAKTGGQRPLNPSPLNPAWAGPNVVNISRSIREGRAFDRLPILADALEEAGCTDAEILNHCRQPGAHVRGCWVVDLLLGKE